MAATSSSSSYISSTNFTSFFSYNIKTGRGKSNFSIRKPSSISISAQQAEQVQAAEEQQTMKQPRPVQPQLNVKSKNMSREYGGQWLSCTTRHVRIYAAYIDPETCAFDQTQMDKLTLILDPTDEFVWTDDTCTRVYSYFQQLVDHYEVISLFSHFF